MWRTRIRQERFRHVAAGCSWHRHCMQRNRRRERDGDQAAEQPGWIFGSMVEMQQARDGKILMSCTCPAIERSTSAGPMARSRRSSHRALAVRTNLGPRGDDVFQFAGPIDGASIVARFYPERERHGVVVAGPEAARERLRREQRMRARSSPRIVSRRPSLAMRWPGPPTPMTAIAIRADPARE